MTTEILTYALLGGLAIALLFSIYSDIRYRLIYNKVTMAIAAAAPVYWYASGSFGLTDIGLHLLVGAVAFAFFALFFYLGMMGGGDVKLFAALSLWFHWIVVLRMMFYASLAGGAVTIIFLIIHKLKQKDGPPRIPYGVAIAAAGLWTVSQLIFNHFG